MVEQLLKPHINNVSKTFFESYEIEDESQKTEFIEIFTKILTGFTTDPKFNKIVNPPRLPTEANVSLDDLLNLVKSSEFATEFNKANTPSSKKRIVLVPKKRVSDDGDNKEDDDTPKRKGNIYNTFSSWIKNAYNNNKEVNNGSKLGPKDFKEIWARIGKSKDKFNQDGWMRYVLEYVNESKEEQQKVDEESEA